MMNLRQRLYAILEDGGEQRVGGWFCDMFLIILITLNTVAVILESVPSISAVYGAWFQSFETASVVIFTLEYGLRIGRRLKIRTGLPVVPGTPDFAMRSASWGSSICWRSCLFISARFSASISGYSVYCARFGS